MSPRTADQNEELREERRSQILDAALTVYVEKGYAATQMDGVAREAGLARGLVYYYFQSKQELLHALFEHVVRRTEAVARHLLEEGREKNPAARLLEYAWLICDTTLDDPRLAFFFMRAPLEFPRDNRAQNKAVTANEQHSARLASVIAEGIKLRVFRQMNPRIAANAYWGALIMNLSELALAAKERKSKTPKERTKLIGEILSCCFEGIGDSKSWRERWETLSADPKRLRQTLDEIAAAGQGGHR